MIEHVSPVNYRKCRQVALEFIVALAAAVVVFGYLVITP